VFLLDWLGDWEIWNCVRCAVRCIHSKTSIANQRWANSCKHRLLHTCWHNLCALACCSIDSKLFSVHCMLSCFCFIVAQSVLVHEQAMAWNHWHVILVLVDSCLWCVYMHLTSAAETGCQFMSGTSQELYALTAVESKQTCDLRLFLWLCTYIAFCEWHAVHHHHCPA